MISTNSSASSGSVVTATVNLPFSAAPLAGGTAQVRNWLSLNSPVLYSSLSQFTSDWLQKDGAGNVNWSGSAGSQNAFYSITELINNGASLFYVLPVANSSSAASLATNLAPTANATFTSAHLLLSPQPDFVVMPKQAYGATMSTANWASVDNAWETYVNSYSTNEAVNPQLTEVLYVTDAGDVASSAAEVSYRQTTTNFAGQNGSRVIFVGNRYTVNSISSGQVQEVASSPAYAGLMNFISTQAPQSYGHAFCGKNYAVVNSALDVVEKITPANLIQLDANGINVLYKVVGKGIYFYSQFTQQKTSLTDGSNPTESVHVVVTRSKVKNLLQSALDSITDEPDDALVRARAVTQCSKILDALVSNGILETYVFADTTSSADEGAGVARFAAKIMSANAISFEELTLTSTFGS